MLESGRSRAAVHDSERTALAPVDTVSANSTASEEGDVSVAQLRQGDWMLAAVKRAEARMAGAKSTPLLRWWSRCSRSGG
jgi:hypothetical protein